MAKPLTAALPQSGSVVSRWYLEEASGTRADAVGSNTLADNNTVTAGTGYPGFSNAGDFERDNSEYLSIADGSQSGLDITSALTISFWYKIESTGNSHAIVAKWSGAAQRAYEVIKNSSNQVEFKITSNGSSAEDSVASTGTFSAGTWVHVVAVYEPSTRMEVYLNGVSDTTNTSSIESAIHNSSGDFLIGADAGGGSPANFADGLIQDVIIWNVALSDANVTSLYGLYTAIGVFGIPFFYT